MKIMIELLNIQNAQDIYDFEIKNRAYFEESLPSRGDEYYKFEVFNKIIRELIDEQNRGECFMYVIRDEVGKMVGRVNFFSIRDGEVKSAELGYRIGKDDNDKGIATKAVRIALKVGFEEHKFGRVDAGTSSENVASQRVLEKNGFVLVEKVENYIEVNGKWMDSLNFAKSL
ncbi:MAG: GNAT family N-acetyltransferase [Clostridia bacterium]|nr:GNAT family N-acetyltransferase [Clostridia bacterium]